MVENIANGIPYTDRKIDRKEYLSTEGLLIIICCKFVCYYTL